MTRTLLTLIFLCAQSHSFARENSDSTNRVTICGRLSPANKAPEIRLIENYQTAVPHLQKERSVKVISSADSFYVSIPATDSIMYFRFLNLPPFRTQNTYAVKKGDSVYITDQKKVNGSKNAVNILNCQLQLDKVYYSASMQGRDTLTFSQNLLALADHKFEKGGLVLQAYAPTIEKNFLKLLELNFYLRSYSIFYSVWKRDGRADKDKLDPVRVMNTLVYDKRLDVEQKIWEVSDKYIEYRVFLLMGYFELTSKGTAIRTNPYRKAFDFIQTTYDGMLKDRMGSYLLIKSIQRDPGILPILPIAAETMTDSLAKQTLMSAYHAVRPGKKALNFDLEDENGKTHRLDDYKGKNLVIKFWFTGCTGCAQIKNSMSVIQQKFKDDKSIVFLNVNMSTQKTHWIEGLKSGKYTSSGEVNLYTGGLGIRHPLVKYYQFASAPQLLLINRRGIVYSANPPIPFTEQKTVELINMIKEMR